jgi:hypothetical protein
MPKRLTVAFACGNQLTKDIYMIQVDMAALVGRCFQSRYIY